MTKHQKLTLIRYTKDAIRKFEAASADPTRSADQALIEAAFAEAIETLDWLKDMPTSD